MQDAFESVRVVDRMKACEIVGISDRTLDRMIARGDAPPATKLSARRIGYRISDLKEWLDGRRQDVKAA